MAEAMLEIKRIRRSEVSVTPAFCFDDCIATFANSVHVDCRPIYACSLKAHYTPCADSASVGRCFGSSFSFDQLLSDMLAITIAPVDGLETALRLIPELIEDGRAPMVSIDGFYCPWDWRYNTICGDVPHTLFITGIDEACGDYICADPYYNIPRAVLSAEQLKNGFCVLMIPECTERKTNDVRLLLRSALDCVGEGIKATQELACACRNGFVPLDEFEGLEPDEPFTVDRAQDKLLLNVSLKELAHNCVRFSNFLRYAGEETSDTAYSDIADGFDALAEKWNLVRMQLLRRIFSRRWNGIGEYIAERLEAMTAEESELIERLRCAVDGEATDAPKASEGSGEWTCRFVDLAEYCNNEGVGSADSDADINDDGECILAEGFPAGELVGADGIRFFLKKKMQGAPDNIRCSVQSLSINMKCRALAFLGCSDYDRCEEGVELIYSDGSREKRTLVFEDWLPDYDGSGSEAAVITAKKLTRYPDGSCDTDDVCCLYLCLLHTGTGAELAQLVLPDCDNLHIFALTALSAV